MAIERKLIINDLYKAAANANETSVLVLCALIRSGGFVAVRVRGGDIDDQPEWGESLFISNFICFVAFNICVAEPSAPCVGLGSQINY